MEELIKRYFDGETTLSEEKTIRDYFSTTPVDQIPNELKSYYSLFGYFSAEQAKLSSLSAAEDRRRTQNRLTMYITPIAVAAALILGIFIGTNHKFKDMEGGADAQILTMTIGGEPVLDEQKIKDYTNEQINKMVKLLDRKRMESKMAPMKKMLLYADNIMNINQ